jgi:predicted 2-oxoglutarate/Fe(II)-dependent dioxygenase YbiX
MDSLFIKKRITPQVTIDDMVYDLQFEKELISGVYDSKEGAKVDKTFRSAISKTLNPTHYLDYCNLLTKLANSFSPNHSSNKLVVKELEYLKYGLTDHFKAHTDDIKTGKKRRRFTTITMLSKTDDMVGGELLAFSNKNNKYDVDLQVGETVVFYSSTMHQVLPITCGGREVLVGWIYDRN